MIEKKINFQSYDGYPLEGTFMKAENERAAVLFVHGICSSRDELGFHSDYAAFLGINGISSLRFDLRYHGVQESNLKELSLCGIVNDIDAAFDKLKDQSQEDTKIYFIIGTSFGGGMTAYWADFYDKKEIKKVILNAPVLDYENDVLERNDLIQGGALSAKAAKELTLKGYVESSDIHFGRGLINELKYINGLRAVKHLAERVVIFHGDQDEDVPLTMSIKNKSKKNKLIIVKGVGHGFGVDDDEDLDFPETKAIHASIYSKALKIFNKCL